MLKHPTARIVSPALTMAKSEIWARRRTRMDIAEPNDLTGSTVIAVLGGVIIGAALLALIVGIFGTASRSQRKDREGLVGWIDRTLARSGVLFSVGLLLIGLQPFLHVVPSVRTVLLWLAVVLLMVGGTLRLWSVLRTSKR
jgi:hypothetical protein